MKQTKTWCLHPFFKGWMCMFYRIGLVIFIIKTLFTNKNDHQK